MYYTHELLPEITDLFIALYVCQLALLREFTLIFWNKHFNMSSYLYWLIYVI